MNGQRARDANEGCEESGREDTRADTPLLCFLKMRLEFLKRWHVLRTGCIRHVYCTTASSDVRRSVRVWGLPFQVLSIFSASQSRRASCSASSRLRSSASRSIEDFSGAVVLSMTRRWRAPRFAARSLDWRWRWFASLLERIMAKVYWANRLTPPVRLIPFSDGHRVS